MGAVPKHTYTAFLTFLAIFIYGFLHIAKTWVAMALICYMVKPKWMTMLAVMSIIMYTGLVVFDNYGVIKHSDLVLLGLYTFIRCIEDLVMKTLLMAIGLVVLVFVFVLKLYPLFYQLFLKFIVTIIYNGY